MKTTSAVFIHLFILNAWIAIAAETTTPPDVLAKAQQLGQQLIAQGYVYPSPTNPPGAKTIDCTGFILLLTETLSPSLPETAKTRILMSDLKESDVISNKDNIITSGDSRTKGIQQALIDIHHGDAVPLSSPKPGDMVQYWMKTSAGTWFGHSGVIDHVTTTNGKTRVWLYGSHKSKGGIGIAPDVGLELREGEDRRIYIIRFK
jgi:hypothetical protein